jgi:hypothetical protein
MTCARHQTIETTLRCSKCETPICPKCAILTPVGYRCPDCGKERSSTQGGPILRQFLCGTIGGIAGFFIAYFAPMKFAILMIFAAILIGSITGQMIWRLLGRRASALAGAMTALGFLMGGTLAPIVSQITSEAMNAQNVFGQLDPWGILFGAIAGGISWYKLR